MNHRPNVCVYYSEGPNFGARLRAVRKRFPNARVCAMAPPARSLTDEEQDLVDEVICTAHDHYSPLHLQACWSLVRRIRRARFDVFVVMFDSLQLNLLTGLSRARRAECWDSEGRIFQLPHSLPAAILRVASRPVLGRTKWAWIQTITWCARSRPSHPDKGLEADTSPTRDLNEERRRRRARALR